VTALVHRVEVEIDVRVRPFDPAPWGPPDLAWERREAGWNRDRRGRLARRPSILLSLFPIGPRRRRPGAREPIQRDVVDDVLPREIAGWSLVNEAASDL